MAIKIFKLIKLLISSKIIFKEPKKSKIVLYDNASLEDFENVLEKKEYFLLINRINQIKEIYIFPRLFYLIFLNYKGNIATSYFVSILEIINPKVVITFTDNCLKFSEITKILEKKMKFIAIQNAYRLDFIEHNYSFKKKLLNYNYNNKIYLPHLFTHGEYEFDLYKKLKIKVKKMTKFGSLRLENALHYLKKNNFNFRKKENDICLISEIIWYAHFSGSNQKFQSDLIKSGVVKLAKYTIDFCREHNKKLIFIPKVRKKGREMDWELSVFKENLNYDDYLFLMKSIKKKYSKRHHQYLAMFRSKVTIGVTSTMLGENLSQNNKILSCNLTKNSVFDFAIKKICSINDCSYIQFKKRLNYILDIDEEKYFSLISKKNMNYLIHHKQDSSQIKFLKEKINRHLS